MRKGLLFVAALFALTACGSTSQSGQSTSVETSPVPVAAAASPHNSAAPPSRLEPSMSLAAATEAGLLSLSYSKGSEQVKFTRYADGTYSGIVWTHKSPDMPTVTTFASGDHAGQVAKVELRGFWCAPPRELTWDAALYAFWKLSAELSPQLHSGQDRVKPYGEHTFVCGKP